MNKLILEYCDNPHGTKESDLAEILMYAKEMYYKGTPDFTDNAYDCLESILKKKNPNNSALHFVGYKMEK